MPKRIFISYSRKDSDVLQELRSQLDAAAFANSKEPIEYWFDKDPEGGITGGEEWEKRLRDEIQRCNIFCVFLTSNWGGSPNCQKELEWAEAEGKWVVQVRVRPVDLPRKKGSCLPNENVWIGALPEQGRRDQYWQEVVKEIQRIRTEPIPIGGSTSPTGGPKPFPDFERLCDLIDRLHIFKKFHDLAHELYEDNSKVILEEVKDGKLNPRTVADCISSIENAVVEFNGLKEDKAAYFDGERDAGQIKNLVDRLQESKDILDTAFRNAGASSSSLAEINNSILVLASTLGNALAYSNERMVATAKNFDPKRFMDSLAGVLAAQEAWKEEWSHLAASIDEARGRLLAEHNILQNTQEFVLTCEPEDLDQSRKRERFMSKWLDLEEGLRPLLEEWKGRPDDAVLDGRGRQGRVRLATCFESIASSFAAMDGGQVDTDTLCAAKRSYGDFVDAFDKYFLRLDKTLKAQYERIGEKLQQQRPLLALAA